MFVLGVTGPSGAGKGTVCEILKEHGYYHIDTDRLVPGVYPQALPELIAAFGPQVATDGNINKKVLAKVAFASPEATNKLNSILHPLIMKRVEELIHQAEREGFRAVAVDGAALLEAHGERVCDKILCVISPKRERLRRVIQRDSISEDLALNRFEAQKPDEYYTANSDAVIENRTLEQLKRELITLLKEWKQ